MTAQIMDSFDYKGASYDLVGCDGTGLVHPEMFGMRPSMIHTGCYRGYFARYAFEEDNLFLKEMTVGPVFTLIFFQRRWKTIQGALPTLGQGGAEGAAVYSGLSLPVPFTGRLLLARDFAREHYVHMGFQKPSAYETLVLLKLQGGKVTEARDLSEDNARRRGQFKERYERNRWRGIGDAFSLDIDTDR
jgi:hypothetical protein